MQRVRRRRRVTAAVLVILALFAGVCLLMSYAWGPAALIAAVFGLRFCGQGMISHLGVTAMARWFRAHRARAVAIAGLGYSIGEAFLPRMAAMAEPLIGWRSVWLVIGGDARDR